MTAEGVRAGEDPPRRDAGTGKGMPLPGISGGLTQDHGRTSREAVLVPIERTFLMSTPREGTGILERQEERLSGWSKAFGISRVF